MQSLIPGPDLRACNTAMLAVCALEGVSGGFPKQGDPNRDPKIL